MAAPRTHTEDVVEFVRRVNSEGGTYHRLDFGNGLVIDGEYDLRDYLPHYGFPADLTGKKVLDVGTASGFFAVEFARRGGGVTAIDIWDGAFQEMVYKAAGVDVEYVQKDLFELDESFGSFDLVFCGSVLLHVWDQFNALRKLRSVCGGQAVVATAVSRDRGLWRRKSVAEFVGHRAQGDSGEYWVTWEPNERALVEMMTTAGFEGVQYRGEFHLRSAPGHEGHDVVHGVVHGFTPEALRKP